MKYNDTRGLAESVIGICLFFVAFIIMLLFVALFGMVQAVRDYYNAVFEI